MSQRGKQISLVSMGTLWVFSILYYNQSLVGEGAEGRWFWALNVAVKSKSCRKIVWQFVQLGLVRVFCLYG